MATIQERVFNVVSEQMCIEKEKIALETRFVEDLSADSLDVVELVMDLEEEFDVNVPDHISEKLKTVGQVVQYISSLPRVAE